MRERRDNRRLIGSVLILVTLLAFSPVGGLPAHAVSPNVVISQVYGGGGNTGATLKNDFIELFNRGTTAVSLNGWSVQYTSATGAGNFGANSALMTELPSVSLAPGQYLLIQEAQGTGGTTSLPTPDVVDATPISMSAIGGKVALVNTTTPLGCNGGSTACTPSALATIVDLVGWDSANFYEGSGPGPSTTNTTAVLRANGGCSDTDNNAADFGADAPNPRNTASPLSPCPAPIPIHDIQGVGHISPKVGLGVLTQGIVTAKRSNGFYMQDPNADSDVATSEAIFVFTSVTPIVSIGDSLLVGGHVSEFRPGGAGSSNLTTTEITSPIIGVLSAGNTLPPPVVIGTGGRIPPSASIEDDASGDVETSGVFDPANDGIDFYESLEGMRAQVNNAVVVGPRSDFGEIVVLGDDGANASVRSARGGVVVRPNDFNPERIVLDDEILLLNSQSMPLAKVGDHVAAPVVGVMDYSFGNFKLQATQPVTVLSGSLSPETTGPPAAYQLTIATFNVDNLDPTDPPSKFGALASQIVTNLRSPDIIAVVNLQDNNGPTNDSVVAANTTYSLMISAIQAAGGPAYQVRQIDPVDDQDGGQPGGNIRQGFLFRTDRGLAFVDRPGGDATTATVVTGVGMSAQLTLSPGRIDPSNPALDNNRKPLAAEFTFKGDKLFVIANHFLSKGGDQPLFGRFQPPSLSSEAQRIQQALVVKGLVDDILAANLQANVLVLGNLNDFEFSAALSNLKGTSLSNLTETLPQNERYTFIFDGNSEALDHILVDNGLASKPFNYDVVHVNAEFTDQATDHDAPVARLCVDRTPPALSVSVSPGSLWPPSHNYVSVNATVNVADNADPNPAVTLVSVTSNEPDNGLGDGDTPNDIVIVDSSTFKLRAERSGTGAGRVYSITYRATDACGNSTVATATVNVPHDQER